MISPTSSAISALNAAGKKLSNSAHNVANSNTDGYKRSRVLLEENTTGGVTATVNKVESSNQSANLPYSNNLPDLSNVDIATEMVDQMTASHLYSANIKTLQTADEMSETALNLKA